MSEEAQRSLGPSAETFVDYWLGRFPMLFSHSWTAMQCIRHEPTFSKYYVHNYTFPPVLKDASVPDWLISSVNDITNQKNRNSPSHSSSPRRRLNGKVDHRRNKTSNLQRISKINGNSESNTLVSSDLKSEPIRNNVTIFGKVVSGTKDYETNNIINPEHSVSKGDEVSPSSSVDSDMERWKKIGFENGVWRPKQRQKVKKKKSDDSRMVWVLPPS